MAYTLHVKCISGMADRCKSSNKVNNKLSLWLYPTTLKSAVETKIIRFDEEWNEEFSFKLGEFTDKDGLTLQLHSGNSDSRNTQEAFINYYTLPIGKVIDDYFFLRTTDEKRFAKTGEVHLVLHMAPNGAKPFVPCERDNKYVNNLESSNASLQTDINSFKEQIDKLKKKISDMELDIELKESQLEDAKQPDPKIAKRIKDLEDANSSIKKTNDDLKKKIKTFKDENQELKDENDKLKEDAQENDKKIAKLNEDLEAAKNSIQSVKDDLEEQIETLEDENQKLKDENDKLNDAAEESDKKVAKLSKDLENANKSLRTAKDDLAKQKKENSCLTGEKYKLYNCVKEIIKMANEQILTDDE